MSDERQGRSSVEHIARVQSRVRSSARWHGWAWLALAVATPVFLLGAVADGGASGDRSLVIAVAFLAVSGGLAVWEGRRPVVGTTTKRFDPAVTAAYVVGVVLAVGVLTWLDEGPTWAMVAVALVPTIPSLVGAWLILRR